MKPFTLTGELEILDRSVLIGEVDLVKAIQEHFGEELADDLGLRVTLTVTAQKPDRTIR